MRMYERDDKQEKISLTALLQRAAAGKPKMHLTLESQILAWAQQIGDTIKLDDHVFTRVA